MAYETVAVNAGTGTNIAVDTVGAQQIQIVKLDVGTDGATSPVSTANPLPGRQEAAAGGGPVTYHVVAAAGTNVASLKNQPGQLFGIQIHNQAAVPVYVKLHNVATIPTVGAGVVRTFGVQAGGELSRAFSPGVAFSTGIGISIVKAIADSGTTAVALAECVVDLELDALALGAGGTIPLTGVTATGSLGTLTTSISGGTVTVALTRVFATGSVGSVWVGTLGAGSSGLTSSSRPASGA